MRHGSSGGKRSSGDSVALIVALYKSEVKVRSFACVERIATHMAFCSFGE